MADKGALRQARHRKKRQTHRQISLNLTADDWAIIEACWEQQSYASSRLEFYRQALLLGVKFRANCGKSNKEKVGTDGKLKAVKPKGQKPDKPSDI